MLVQRGIRPRFPASFRFQPALRKSAPPVRSGGVFGLNPGVNRLVRKLSLSIARKIAARTPGDLVGRPPLLQAFLYVMPHSGRSSLRSPRMPPPRKSARRFAARRRSITLTGTRAIRSRRRSSRRSTRRTKSSRTTSSGRSTDQFGWEGLQGGGAEGHGFTGVQDVFSTMQDVFAEAFNGTFGSRAPPNGRRGEARRNAKRGQDLRIEQSLSLRESIFGCTKVATVRSAVVCTECEGSGARRGTQPEVCRNCSGSGRSRRRAASCSSRRRASSVAAAGSSSLRCARLAADSAPSRRSGRWRSTSRLGFAWAPRARARVRTAWREWRSAGRSHRRG